MQPELRVPPGFFVLLQEMLESCLKAAQHFGTRFTERRTFWIGRPLAVFAKLFAQIRYFIF